MKFEKGRAKLPNSGRKPGSINKSTASCKEALELAFEGIGGVPALCEWAQANRTEFYKLYSKVLPLQIGIQAELNIKWPLPQTVLDQ